MDMTVWVVQDQKQVDYRSGQLRSKFDFTPAQEYGEVDFLLQPGASPFDLPPVLARLHTRLAGFTDADYLLLTGNPVLIGLAVAVAAARNKGKVKMLQWSGTKKRYISVSAIDIFP